MSRLPAQRPRPRSPVAVDGTSTLRTRSPVLPRSFSPTQRDGSPTRQVDGRVLSPVILRELPRVERRYADRPLDVRRAEIVDKTIEVPQRVEVIRYVPRIEVIER